MLPYTNSVSCRGPHAEGLATTYGSTGVLRTFLTKIDGKVLTSRQSAPTRSPNSRAHFLTLTGPEESAAAEHLTKEKKINKQVGQEEGGKCDDGGAGTSSCLIHKWG